MGKETDLLEAARNGNAEFIRNLMGKLRPSTNHHKAHKKRTIFQSHHTHHYRAATTGPASRASGLNCRDLNGETLLHLATVNNHKSVVSLLINGGAQVNSQDNQGCLPLHLAAWTGNSDICRILLIPLTINDVNRQNKVGDTSLHIASQYGHSAVVRLLLQHEANPMIRNIRGESSLDLACFYGRLETVSLLINDQPALLHQMQLSHSPLHLASRNGQKDVVRKLLQAGYNINTKTKSGSALHEAATYGKVEVMKLLLQSGIDKSIKDKNNQTVKELLESQHTAVAGNLLLILSGGENLYHDLSSKSEAHIPATNKQKLCKHGKSVRGYTYSDMHTQHTHQRRDRERSSSGQTSDGGSPTPQTPSLADSGHSNCHHKRSGRHRTDHTLKVCPVSEQGQRSPTSISNHPQQSHTKRCRCQHLKQSNNERSTLNQPNGSTFTRHQSCPGPFQLKNTDLAPALVLGGAINSSSIEKERTRHKSCSVRTVDNDSDYIKLSDTTSSSLPDTSTDNRVYSSISQTVATEHVYDRVQRPSAAVDDDPVYDRVPKPCPIRIVDQWDISAGSPLSPDFYNQSSNNRMYESQDSVYNSPGSLSPELNVSSSRKYLGHIYVNLTNYRSTPDLNRINAEAPKKPPRTPDTHLTQDGCGKSRDYACVNINSLAISKSQDNITSDTASPVEVERTSDRLIYSVPPQKAERHFIFPPIIQSTQSEDTDDAHDYENMTAAIHQYRSKQPPKAMPRRSKNKECSLGMDSNSNYTHSTGDEDPHNAELDHGDKQRERDVDSKVTITGACQGGSYITNCMPILPISPSSTNVPIVYSTEL